MKGLNGIHLKKKCLYGTYSFDKKMLKNGLRKKRLLAAHVYRKKKKRILLMKACKGIIVLKRGERCCKAGWKK